MRANDKNATHLWQSMPKQQARYTKSRVSCRACVWSAVRKKKEINDYRQHRAGQGWLENDKNTHKKHAPMCKCTAQRKAKKGSLFRWTNNDTCSCRVGVSQASSNLTGLPWTSWAGCLSLRLVTNITIENDDHRVQEKVEIERRILATY